MQQVGVGHKCSVVTGAALHSSKVKFKVRSEAAKDGEISSAVTGGVVAVLSAIRQLAATNVAMDRGHKHSFLIC